MAEQPEPSSPQRPNGIATPRPDPTSLTTQQLERAIDATEDLFEAKLDVIRERIDGIGEARKLLADAVARQPSEVDRATAQLRELAKQRFLSIDTQFAERDVRLERDSASGKESVAFALTAQKEAVGQLGELVRAGFDNMNGKIDDLKDRVGKTETSVVALTSTDLGARAQKTEQRGAGQYAVAIMGAVVGLVGITLAVVGFIIANSGK